MPARGAVDPVEEPRPHRVLDPFFEVADAERVEYRMALGRAEVLDLVGMTPFARHMSRAEMKGGGLLPGRVTVSVPATAYRARSRLT